MLHVHYKPTFVRQFDTFEKDLQLEILEKIEFFKDPRNHKQLKVHKLHGHLKEQYSFSVNFKYRIVFSYISKQEVVLLTLGDHDIYK